MIASVAGTVAAVGLDSAVVVVGGVGMRVQATPGTLANLRVGSSTTLATSLVVREDALTLFGFADDEERDVFELLQTVSGVGPRLALAMLAVHTPDLLRHAVAQEDYTALMRVPGIGRKGAQRIVLEIGDRLGPPRPSVESGAALSGAVAQPAPRSEVVEALVGLGWPVRSAEQAVAEAVDEAPADASTSELLRSALRTLAGHPAAGGNGRG
jgi:Holliday junction DNA helicase RuvA